MILARTHQYGLLALIELARLPGREYVVCRDIAERFELPQPYLAKLMQQLVHAGLIESVRGRHGGYRLLLAPEQIKVGEVIRILDTDYGDCHCLLGLQTCNDEHACALHEQWSPLRDGLFDMLEGQTLRQLL